MEQTHDGPTKLAGLFAHRDEEIAGLVQAQLTTFWNAVHAGQVTLVPGDADFESPHIRWMPSGDWESYRVSLISAMHTATGLDVAFGECAACPLRLSESNYRSRERKRRSRRT